MNLKFPRAVSDLRTWCPQIKGTQVVSLQLQSLVEQVEQDLVERFTVLWLKEKKDSQHTDTPQNRNSSPQVLIVLYII